MTSALGQRLEERRQPPREDVPGGPFLLLFLLLPGSSPSLHIKAASPHPLSLPTPLRRALGEGGGGGGAPRREEGGRRGRSRDSTFADNPFSCGRREERLERDTSLGLSEPAGWRPWWWKPRSLSCPAASPTQRRQLRPACRIASSTASSTCWWWSAR